jgi:hypothetical protein
MNEILITHWMEQSTPIVSVPLTNSNRLVCLYQDDFDYLMALGLSPKWVLTNGQILERGTRLSVTRLVADAKKGQGVKLFDKDPTNLRHPNLILVRAGGRLNARDVLRNTEERPYNLDKPTLTHKYIIPNHIENIT